MINELKSKLEERYNENYGDEDFENIWQKLSKDAEKAKVILKMEETGGEPRIIKLKDKMVVFDSYKKIPEVRKSLCYDEEALNKRKQNKPKSDCLTEVSKIGSKLLTEELYYEIQEEFSFDENISSWVLTPEEIRGLGGAIFCDRRFSRTFTYHNTAGSYYSSRGFRTFVEI